MRVRARGSFSNSARRYQYGSRPFALAVSIKLYNSLVRWDSPDAYSSLPLMGIENQRADFGVRLRHPRLITPHGDRKRNAAGKSSLATALSLPLMGIENRRHPRRRPPPRSAHYPSWGSKTRRGQRREYLAVGRLITPHGDRKRGSPPPAAHTPHRAHYPSWGSKTHLPRVHRTTARPAHYPSWGSKTRACPSRGTADSAAHYPSWGSKTPHRA